MQFNNRKWIDFSTCSFCPSSGLVCSSFALHCITSQCSVPGQLSPGDVWRVQGLRNSHNVGRSGWQRENRPSESLPECIFIKRGVWSPKFRAGIANSFSRQKSTNKYLMTKHLSPAAASYSRRFCSANVLTARNCYNRRLKRAPSPQYRSACSTSRPWQSPALRSWWKVLINPNHPCTQFLACLDAAASPSQLVCPALPVCSCSSSTDSHPPLPLFHVITARNNKSNELNSSCTDVCIDTGRKVVHNTPPPTPPPAEMERKCTFNCNVYLMTDWLTCCGKRAWPWYYFAGRALSWLLWRTPSLA